MTLYAFDKYGNEISPRCTVFDGDFTVDSEKESVLEALRDRTNVNDKNRFVRNCIIGKIREK